MTEYEDLRDELRQRMRTMENNQRRNEAQLKPMYRLLDQVLDSLARIESKLAVISWAQEEHFAMSKAQVAEALELARQNKTVSESLRDFYIKRNDDQLAKIKALEDAAANADVDDPALTEAIAALRETVEADRAAIPAVVEAVKENTPVNEPPVEPAPPPQG